MRRLPVGGLLLLSVVAAGAVGQSKNQLAGHVYAYTTGKPLTGLTLSAGGQTTVTDANGRFEFKNLPADVNSVSFEFDGMASSMGVQPGDQSVRLLLRPADFHILKAGEAIPEIASKEWLNSPPLTKNSLKGKVLFLDMWAINCASCRQELPEVEAMSKRFGNKLLVIGVHWQDGKKKDVEAFVKKNGITYPVVIDKGGDCGLFSDQFISEGSPTHVVVGPDGTIQAINLSVKEASDKIAELVSDK